MTKEKQSSCSLGGARLTFVWVIELEDVGSRRVIWQHHHPSSNTHLLAGAGLVLRQIWDYSGLDSVQCLVTRLFLIFENRTYVLSLRGPQCLCPIEYQC